MDKKMAEVLKNHWFLETLWKVKPTGFADRFDMEYDREKSKDDARAFGLSNRKDKDKLPQTGQSKLSENDKKCNERHRGSKSMAGVWHGQEVSYLNST